MLKERLRRIFSPRHMLEAIVVIALVVAIQLWQTLGLPQGAAPPLVGVRNDGVATSLDEFIKVGADGTASQSQFAIKGGGVANKPVLVVFWATWCVVCKSEEHNIVAVAKDWPVFSVAMQSGDAAAVTKHLQERGVPYPALVDSEGKSAAAWRIAGVPTHFIIDAQGNVRFRVVGYATEWGLRARLWWAQRFAA